MGKSGLSQLQLYSDHPISFLPRRKDSIKYLFITVLFLTFRTTSGSIIVKRDHPELQIQVTDSIGESEHDVQQQRGEEVIDEHHHKRTEGEITDHNGPLHVHPNNLPANLSFQDVIALRRDAVRYRIRNTSELDTGIHNESSSESTGHVISGISHNGLNSTYLHRIIVVPKAFHFHIPIISRRYMDSNHLPTVSYRTEREDQDKETPYPALSMGILPSEYEEATASLALKTLENFQQSESEEPYVFEKRNVDVTNELLPRSTHLLHDGKKLDNMESLLDQHPKLIPPVNRKRDSGKLKQDLVEDEFWQFEREAENETEPRPVIATKRNVKTLSFSQNVVDSILNHEDDFVKYQTNVKAHAEKLGLKPHEVLHAMVQGKSLNGEDNNNGKRKEVHEIRHVFQTFLRKPEETEQTKGGEWNTFKPFDAHMKTLKREKRGLKKWLRKWLGPGPTEKTTEKPEDIVVKGEPDLQVVIKMKSTPKEKKEKAKESGEEEDEDEKEDEEDKEGETTTTTTAKPKTPTKHHKEKNKPEEKSTKSPLPDPQSFENEQQIEVEIHSRKGRKKEKDDKTNLEEKEEKGENAEKPKRSSSPIPISSEEEVDSPTEKKSIKSLDETKEKKDIKP